MKLNILKFPFVVLLVIAVLFSCSKQENIYVQDQAQILSGPQVERLEEFQNLLLKERNVHLMIITLKDAVADIDQTAVELFEKHTVGQSTDAARGLLLVFDTNQKQVRIEVGYDLEAVLPDGFIANLEHEQMLPFFQHNRIADGIEAQTEMIVTRLMRNDSPPDQQPKSTTDLKHLSGGAGAKVKVTSPDAPKQESPEAIQDFVAQATPLKTLEKYRDSLVQRVKSSELDIYTDETKAFFRNWLITDTQQKNALRVLNDCLPDAETIESGELAVIRFPVNQRQASPYFLKRQAHGWQLDFATMTKTIGFNHRNQWHLRSSTHPYMFAFSDWNFDQNGFPH